MTHLPQREIRQGPEDTAYAISGFKVLWSNRRLVLFPPVWPFLRTHGSALLEPSGGAVAGCRCAFFHRL
ncbi:hypothetical protein XHV734_4539 [Xanthomonas hortorum pv. vitians]|nr:hypothetical protein XHV734_4539 [Xanthomonas hortorum pv. vitians]